MQVFCSVGLRNVGVTRLEEAVVYGVLKMGYARKQVGAHCVLDVGIECAYVSVDACGEQFCGRIAEFSEVCVFVSAPMEGMQRSGQSFVLV